MQPLPQDVIIRATPTSVLVLITLAHVVGKAMFEMIVALLNGRFGVRGDQGAWETGNKVMNS